MNTHPLAQYHGGRVHSQGGNVRGYYRGYYFIASRKCRRLAPVLGIFRPTQITEDQRADAKVAHMFFHLFEN